MLLLLVLRAILCTFATLSTLLASAGEMALRVPDGLDLRAGRTRGMIFKAMFHGRLPAITTDDLLDAVHEFTDPQVVLNRADQIRVEHKRKRASFYVSFYHDIWDEHDGPLNILCGVSRSDSHDLDTVSRKALEEGSAEQVGDFENLRYTSRPERVRAIARCLATLSGMPPLKPVKLAIQEYFVQESAFAAAEAYLRAWKPKDVTENGSNPVAAKGYSSAMFDAKDKFMAPGSPVAPESEPYRKAFRCLLAQAAHGMEKAVGGVVIVRAHDEAFRSFLLTVSSEKAIRRIKHRDFVDLDGLWPARVAMRDLGYIVEGYNGPVEQLLREALLEIPRCMRESGLSP